MVKHARWLKIGIAAGLLGTILTALPATVARASGSPATGSSGTLGYDTSSNNNCNAPPTGSNTFVVAQVADTSAMYTSGGSGAVYQSNYVSCTYNSVQAPDVYIFLGDSNLASYTPPSYCTSYWPNGGTPPAAWCLGLDEAMYSYNQAVSHEDPTYHCLWYDNLNGCIAPGAMEWWLDVEGSSMYWTANTTNNQDIIDGAHFYLSSYLTLAVGIYSNTSAWNTITGGLNLSSVGLPEWVPANECFFSGGCSYNNGGTNWESVYVWSPYFGWSALSNLDMTQWCAEFQAGNSMYNQSYVEYGPFASEGPSDVKYSQGWFEKGGQPVKTFYYLPSAPFDGDIACY